MVPVALAEISRRTDRAPVDAMAWDAAGSQRAPEFDSVGPSTEGSDPAVADPEDAPEQSAEEKNVTMTPAPAVMYCRAVRNLPPKETSIPSETGAHCVRVVVAKLIVFARTWRAAPPERALAAASLEVQSRDAST